ncbi:melanocortin-2 receptor accessory protein 2A-like [Coregonus clupeaformis]|uniref:melanocortin-2 receptor accessory protein 2A-like n=1 Tax=Coregonus clupeaformis TaxID=59861 RepID=UPI001E1C81E8|nr:melanocortin-2 receptor accessory protein 2A-like [Coregonus clupeaformis]
MSEFNQSNISGGNAPDPDYKWTYEYYDDEEPVSFEGLKAHRYSIVIGFWVGLAVFVIFMFFVLTLLTKTGAPHPEGAEPRNKRVHLTSCVEDLCPPADPVNRPCLHRPLLDSSLSRSLFHCYINEEQAQAQGGSRPRAGAGAVGAPRGGLVQGPGQGRSGSPEEEEEGVVVGIGVGVGVSLALQGAAMLGGNRTDHREAMFLSHFNIPNVVNSEHSSALGENDLLLGEPPIIMEGECRSHGAHHTIDWGNRQSS